MRLTHQLTQHPNILFRFRHLQGYAYYQQGQQCSDTASTLAKVYLGFIPDFKVTEVVLLTRIRLLTLLHRNMVSLTAGIGIFGDISTTSDTSILRNATYLYPSAQDVDVQLIVTNSKGCTDTIAKQVTISDKPAILLPFSDTLICVKRHLAIACVNCYRYRYIFVVAIVFNRQSQYTRSICLPGVNNQLYRSGE